MFYTVVHLSGLQENASEDSDDESGDEGEDEDEDEEVEDDTGAVTDRDAAARGESGLSVSTRQCKTYRFFRFLGTISDEFRGLFWGMWLESLTFSIILDVFGVPA